MTAVDARTRGAHLLFFSWPSAEPHVNSRTGSTRSVSSSVPHVRTSSACPCQCADVHTPLPPIVNTLCHHYYLVSVENAI